MSRVVPALLLAALMVAPGTDVRAQSPAIAAKPQVKPAQLPKGAIGASLESVLGKNRLMKTPKAATPAEKLQVLFTLLKTEPPGLATPTLLSANQPRTEWASLSSFFADFNAQYGFFGLNGRPQERLVVAFKPREARKPVLVTVSVGQALAGGRTPSLLLRGSGVSITQNLPTTPTLVHAVVTPTDTNWYKLDLSSGPDTVVLITSVELTPTT